MSEEAWRERVLELLAEILNVLRDLRDSDHADSSREGRG